MNDFYAECLVERGTQRKMTVAVIASAAGAALGAVSVLYIGPAGLAIFLVMGVLCFLSLRNRNVEFEYLLAGEEFSVDQILNKSGRKNMLTYLLNDIQAVAPENSAKIKEFDRQVKQTKDYSSGRPDALRYVLIHQKSGNCEKIIIEPDDKLLRCFKMALPRKFIKM